MSWDECPQALQEGFSIRSRSATLLSKTIGRTALFDMNVARGVSKFKKYCSGNRLPVFVLHLLLDFDQ